MYFILNIYTADLVNLICRSSLYENFLNLYVTIIMTCERQIKNSSDLFHIDTITVPLEEERKADRQTCFYNDIIIKLLDGLGRVN